ncbi:MAG: cytidine deaminase [Sphingobacteriales bacterium]|uniref:cytidine deaminase n=1 Tax=Hydrotalea flava TaxID=714549 RepID=UPI000834FC5B|nr:cytidine deaminase [Hydrotalea flava]RTL54801.1 MAG: cytidine deaminase [Sphingobacteriales bacterium]
MQQQYQFNYQLFQHIQELAESDALLLEKARINTKLAYAPYSQFQVSAAALLSNGEIVFGTNQENASYPVGICAERSLLASASVLFPQAHVVTMAISYQSLKGNSNKPISPCGMCRQAIIEHQTRYGHTMRLILSGQTGQIFVIENAAALLPLAFISKEI